MSTKPSQNAIGRALGLTSSAMVKLRKQGMPVDSVEAAQAWRVERQNVAARKPLPAGEPPGNGAPRMPPFGRDPFKSPPRAPSAGDDEDIDGDLEEARDRARTRREIAEANIAEMNEQKQRRELISVAAIKQQLATEYSTAREALMQIPARLSPMLAAESNAVTIQNMLEAEIHQSLHQLAGAAEGVERIEGAFD